MRAPKSVVKHHIGGDDPHAESTGEQRHAFSDAPEAHDSQRLAPELGPEQQVGRPAGESSRAHDPIALDDPARQGEQEGHRQIGGRVRQSGKLRREDDNGQPGGHHERVRDGLVFGAVIVVGAVVVGIASRSVLSRAVDRRVARAAAIALVVLVLAALAAGVVRAGGPVDFVSARWHEFSNRISAQVGQTPGRIVSGNSSNRWRWWSEAWHAFTDKPLQGTGAGTFELIDRVQRDSPLATTEPHSVPLQFLSETGIVGFLLYATVVAAATTAATMTARDRPSTRTVEVSADRGGDVSDPNRLSWNSHHF